MEQVFTISQLNGFIRDVVQSAFPASLWVSGEIQNYDRSKDRKHVFFELVEKNSSSNDVLAKIGLVIFDRTKNIIKETLKQSENAFDLKDGIEVKFLCRLDFYAQHGAMRLIVEDIDPVYTLGKIAQEKQKLIKDLANEGLIDLNKKHPMPFLPLKIGLITAFDSAAYNDFCDELKKSGFGFQLWVADAVMQGKRCEASVKKALFKLNEYNDLDLVVLTRGGGSLADLASFDSRVIAETIAKYPKPVITGIGHEINTSVADVVAHTSAKTPTAAAQILIQKINEVVLQLEQHERIVISGAESLLTQERQEVRHYALQLRNQTQEYFITQKQHIQRMGMIVQHSTERHMTHNQQELKEIKLDLDQSIRLRFERLKSKIDHYSQLVRVLDPINNLKKGYSISRNANGELIRTVDGLKKGDQIKTQLSMGVIESSVCQTTKG